LTEGASARGPEQEGASEARVRGCRGSLGGHRRRGRSVAPWPPRGGRGVGVVRAGGPRKAQCRRPCGRAGARGPRRRSCCRWCWGLASASMGGSMMVARAGQRRAGHEGHGEHGATGAARCGYCGGWRGHRAARAAGARRRACGRRGAGGWWRARRAPLVVAGGGPQEGGGIELDLWAGGAASGLRVRWAPAGGGGGGCVFYIFFYGRKQWGRGGEEPRGQGRG
jgi:hypothetical protein